MRYILISLVLLISTVSAACGPIARPPDSCPRGSSCYDKWVWEHECHRDPDRSDECKKIFNRGIANSIFD
jgi:hypothetical protein